MSMLPTFDASVPTLLAFGTPTGMPSVDFGWGLAGWGLTPWGGGSATGPFASLPFLAAFASSARATGFQDAAGLRVFSSPTPTLAVFD